MGARQRTRLAREHIRLPGGRDRPRRLAVRGPGGAARRRGRAHVPADAHAGPRRAADETGNAYLNPKGLSGDGTVKTARWRRAEITSSNGHSNARALARICSALAAPASACWSPRPSRWRAARHPPAMIWCSSASHAWGSASSSPSPSARSVRTRAPSATSEPAGRSASPTPTQASRSPARRSRDSGRVAEPAQPRPQRRPVRVAVS